MAKSEGGAAEKRELLPAQANVLLLGGASASGAAQTPMPDGETADFFAAHDAALSPLVPDAFTAGALDDAARFLSACGVRYAPIGGVPITRLAAVRVALGTIRLFGAGESRALAERPEVVSINGVRIGFLALNERMTTDGGELAPEADALDTRAFDRVRMLLPQCDHVLVFCRAGLPGFGLPLPEWRERARQLLRAGASVVAFTLPGEPDGWEEFEHGLILYGLGTLSGGERQSLAVSLALRRNHAFTYEARLLEEADGALAFSKNEKAKNELNARNALLFDERAYYTEARRRCRAYVESEAFCGAYMPACERNRGLKGLLRTKDDVRAEDGCAMLALLQSESPRLAALHGLNDTYGGERRG